MDVSKKMLYCSFSNANAMCAKWKLPIKKKFKVPSFLHCVHSTGTYLSRDLQQVVLPSTEVLKVD